MPEPPSLPEKITSAKESMFHLGNKLLDLEKALIDEDKPNQAYQVAQMRSTLTKYQGDLTIIRESL